MENELAFAFPTNIPIVDGHVLISTKRCVAKVDDLSSKELQAIFDLIRNLNPALAKAFGAQGFNFAGNEGKKAGQSVPHFHIHMVPRKEGDSGINGQDPRKQLYRPGERKAVSEEELRKVAGIIKSHI